MPGVMRIVYFYKSLKYAAFGGIFLLVGLCLYTGLTEKGEVVDSLEEIPNYNYVPEIEALRKEGRLGEALEVARFVLQHPDMPGQAEAQRLAQEIETELNSWTGRARRAVSGFVTGSGTSVEEIGGGIASDMIVYGDIRDLLKQGYYKVTGQETDPVIAALAGVGLLTEVVDLADWAPAVLKAFRKVGALSDQFADFVIKTARKSLDQRKLDEGLVSVFGNIRHLSDEMGLARTAATFKHIDDPADLAAVAAVARKNADTAYFMTKVGGADGVSLMKQFGNSDDAVAQMARAVKKGPAGIAWLKKGGIAHPYVVKTRIVARVLKNHHMGRFTNLVRALALQYPGLRYALWGCTALSFVLSGFFFVESGYKFYQAVGRQKREATA